MKMICIKQTPWVDMAGNPYQFRAPQYREIVVVEGEELAPNGLPYVYLAGYDEISTTGGGEPARQRFAKRHFVPLIDPLEKFDFRTRIKNRQHEDA